MGKERILEPVGFNTLRAAVILQDMVDRVSEYEKKMEVAESQSLGGFIEIYDRGDDDIDSIIVTRKTIETMKEAFDRNEILNEYGYRSYGGGRVR